MRGLWPSSTGARQLQCSALTSTSVSTCAGGDSRAQAAAFIAMTHPRRTLERPPRHATVAVGLAIVIMALAIGGAMGHRPDSPLGQPPAPSAGPPVRSAQSVVAASNVLPSGHASAPPGPTGTPDLRRAREAPALDP